jgi:CheY-like chemotaxis protein
MSLGSESLAGLRILVVDDHDDSRDFLQQVLVHAGASWGESTPPDCSDSGQPISVFNFAGIRTKAHA